jgi:hypothetical protein
VIGKWFESYDEAWTHLLTRETPLEDFWAVLPEREGSILALWLIEPPPQVKDAVHDLLARLGELERVAVVPEHFLHISIQVTVAYLQSPSVVSIRHALNQFRGREFGSFHAASVRLCLIPIARSTFLCPWEVAGTQPLLHA